MSPPEQTTQNEVSVGHFGSNSSLQPVDTQHQWLALRDVTQNIDKKEVLPRDCRRTFTIKEVRYGFFREPSWFPQGSGRCYGFCVRGHFPSWLGVLTLGEGFGCSQSGSFYLPLL